MLFLPHTDCLILVITHISESSFLYTKKNNQTKSHKTNKKQQQHNTASTQASHSFKSHGIEILYNTLGKICCLTLRCCLKKGHSTAAGLTALRMQNLKQWEQENSIFSNSFLHYVHTLEIHKHRHLLALQLHLIKERLATEPII